MKPEDIDNMSREQLVANLQEEARILLSHIYDMQDMVDMFQARNITDAAEYLAEPLRHARKTWEKGQRIIELLSEEEE